MIYLGAENIISPLGENAKENFDAALQGKSGLSAFQYNDHSTFAGRKPGFEPIKHSVACIEGSLQLLDQSLFEKGKKQLIISTTKGEIEALKKGDTTTASLYTTLDKFKKAFPSFDDVQLVSNACISGVLALIVADNNLRYQDFDHIVVIGFDQLSEFTLAGFDSFFALSDEICKPFDKNRKGISLGEGASSLVLSKNPALFKEDAFQLLSGSSMNDANHISGPSRTGEGLYRSIAKTILLAGIEKNTIDFISAHGTGTNYNDEMESIALDRLGLNEVPMNSFKGYFGHTFGAAGTIETSMCLQSMRNNIALNSFGYEEQGVSKDINTLSENLSSPINTVLKTASGFGGCNASIMIKK